MLLIGIAVYIEVKVFRSKSWCLSCRKENYFCNYLVHGGLYVLCRLLVIDIHLDVTFGRDYAYACV
jgi:hypothetical protein